MELVNNEHDGDNQHYDCHQSYRGAMGAGTRIVVL